MNEQQKAGPTALGKLVLIVFVGACIAGAAYYFRDLVAPGGRGQGMVDIDQFRKVEAPDTQGVTTVNEYSYVPAEKLPPVKGVSSYAWDESVFAKKHGFKVNLRLIDDPVVARDAFATGESHILWGTLDMMVLFTPELMKDSRTAPRIYQQVDWSSGTPTRP